MLCREDSSLHTDVERVCVCVRLRIEGTHSAAHTRKRRGTYLPPLVQSQLRGSWLAGVGNLRAHHVKPTSVKEAAGTKNRQRFEHLVNQSDSSATLAGPGCEVAPS